MLTSNDKSTRDSPRAERIAARAAWFLVALPGLLLLESIVALVLWHNPERSGVPGPLGIAMLVIIAAATLIRFLEYRHAA